MQFLIGKVGPTAWNIWENLFDERDGTHALVIAGYATPSPFTTSELLPPIIQWMKHSRDRELLMFIGVQEEGSKAQNAESRARTLDLLSGLLGQLDEDLRRQVHIHLVPGLHAKAYAVYEGHPLNAADSDASCLRLMLGSSNVSYTAFASNYELDVYLYRPHDALALDGAAQALKKMLLAIYFGTTESEPPPIQEVIVEDSEVGSLWGADQAFYDELCRRAVEVQESLALAALRAEDLKSRRLSMAALRSDE